MTKIKHSLLCGVTAFAAVGVVAVASMTAAQAGGFALREQSAIGQGSSFAGVAAGGSLSSMFWNPAGLASVDGTNTESVYSFVIPEAKVRNVQHTVATGQGALVDTAYRNKFGILPTPGDVALDAFIPSSYAGSQLTEDLFVGLSVNAPYGMSTKAGKGNTKTSFHAATAKIFTTDVKVNVAYRINDVFTVGAGAGVMYNKVRMTSIPEALTDSAYSELLGDGWSPVFSAGVVMKPTENTEIGVGFRSAAWFDLEGTQTLPGGTQSAQLNAVAGVHNIRADLVLPETVTIGLRQRVSDAFTLLGGFEWTNWSRVGTSAIHGSPAGSKLVLEYKDGWYASLGGEYNYNEHLTLRAGVGYEKSPIPEEHRNLRLADADRVWTSIGASYQVSDKIGVDLGYSHVFVEDAYVSGASSSGAFKYTGTSKGKADIISASLRYNWKPEPMFEGDEPIVRKY